MDGALAIQFGDVELWLLPERAVWCRASGSVWIADLHLGKEQTARRSGIPVPDLLMCDLSRLTAILRGTGARQLYILGDLFHSRFGRSERLNEAFTAWRTDHHQVDMILVRGNHDLRSGDPPVDWQLPCVDPPQTFGAIQLTHHPLFDDRTWNLAGHLHPKWRGVLGAEDIRLPCFLLRQKTLVLPAFGSFIDHGLIATTPCDQIYAIADGTVIAVTPQN